MPPKLHPQRASCAPHQVSCTARPAPCPCPLTCFGTQETHWGAPLSMSLRTPIFPPRQPPTACPDRAHQRRHPDGLPRRDGHTLPEADSNRPSSTDGPSQGLDGRKRGTDSWSLQVPLNIQHCLDGVFPSSVPRQRRSAETPAPHHGGAQLAAPLRFLPKPRTPSILPSAVAQRVQHAQFGHLLHGPGQSPLGLWRRVAHICTFSIPQHVRARVKDPRSPTQRSVGREPLSVASRRQSPRPPLQPAYAQHSQRWHLLSKPRQPAVVADGNAVWMVPARLD